MSTPEHNKRERMAPAPDGAVEAAAGLWLARRDRGLTGEEEREFSIWLRADPAHQPALDELEGPFHALDRAAGLRPAASLAPDADFLVDSRRSRRRHARLGAWLAVGAAAAIAFGLVVFRRGQPGETEPPAGVAVTRRAPERRQLPDGSIVELRNSAQLDVGFTREERRVRLTGGEAYFTVAKNPKRPFVVVAGAVVVRAVGTEFSVNRGASEIAVLVTEGRVRVENADSGKSLLSAPSPSSARPANDGGPGSPPADPVLAAGEEVVIPVRGGVALPASAAAVTPEQMENDRGWRSVWLTFSETPLIDVVNEFNRNNARKVLVADPTTSRILVSGTFRVDSADAFARLLESNFGVKVTLVPADRDLLRKH